MPTLIVWFRFKKLIYRPVLQNWMKIVGYQIFLRITRFVILVIRPDYREFCLRSTPVHQWAKYAYFPRTKKERNATLFWPAFSADWPSWWTMDALPAALASSSRPPKSCALCRHSWARLNSHLDVASSASCFHFCSDCNRPTQALEAGVTVWVCNQFEFVNRSVYNLKKTRHKIGNRTENDCGWGNYTDC